MGLGVYGRSIYSQLGNGAGTRARGGALAKNALTLVEIGGSAGLLSFLAAFSRARNVTLGPVIKNGEIFGVPFSLAGAVLAGVLSMVGSRGPNQHLMNVALGGASAWLTTAGIKLGYRGTALTPAVAGVLPPGYSTQMGAYPQSYYYGGVGAVPETEALFREAGV